MLEKSGVAIGIGVSRNEADHVSLVLDGDLHKFAFAQKAVHTRVFGARRYMSRGVALTVLIIIILLIFVLLLRARLGTGQHPSKENETRELERIQADGADRHASQYSGQPSHAAKPHSGGNSREVSYNISTEQPSVASL